MMGSAGAKRILLVEDEPGLLYVHHRMLSKHQFEITEARNGQEAIAAFEEHEGKFDAILSDLNMPVINGIELAKRNHHQFNLPFIACTSGAHPDQVKDLLGYGVRDFILKPAKEMHMVNIVNNALSRFERSKAAVAANGGASESVNMSIPSRLERVSHAENWIGGIVANKGVPGGSERFAMYVGEFIMNAYEHGNLGLSEQLKCELILAGQYENALTMKEDECNKNISIETSFVKNSVEIVVGDEGAGFDFNRYLKMSGDAMAKRLMMPNGRGIQMAMLYFDRISYSEGGSQVKLVKKLADA
ncbi:MAG: response regulator [Nitrospinae bacterium]|nr:response regulator [Nitrospinota bacterium]